MTTFFDSIPADANQIVSDYNQMRSSLAHIKSCLQAIGDGWDNTDATLYSINKIASSYNIGTIARTIEQQDITSGNELDFAIDPAGIYKINLDMTVDVGMASAGLYIRFNSDTGAVYDDQYWFSDYTGFTDTAHANTNQITVGANHGGTDHFIADFIVACHPSNTKIGYVNGKWSYGYDDTDPYQHGAFSGLYDGPAGINAAISSIQLYLPASATFTGKSVCERLI